MSLYMQQEQGRQDGNHTDASRSYNPKHTQAQDKRTQHKRPLTPTAHKGALIRSNLITITHYATTFYTTGTECTSPINRLQIIHWLSIDSQPPQIAHLRTYHCILVFILLYIQETLNVLSSTPHLVICV